MSSCSCDACHNRLITDEQQRDTLCGFCAAQCFPVCEYGVRIQKNRAERTRLHGGTLAVDPIRDAAQRVMNEFVQMAERAAVEQGIPMLKEAARTFLQAQIVKRLGR